MHSSPHPNQVRSACERCRRQKLRCSRPVGAAASCARCTRLGLACQPGLQRRVGRPPKKDLVLRKPSEALALDANRSAAAAEDVQFLFGNPVPGVDWDLGSFCFNSPDSLPFPMEDWPAVRELDPEQSEQQHQQQVIILPDSVHFQTLSRLNVEIHKGLEYMTRVAAKARFDEFICEGGNDMLNGYRNVQNVIKSTQEFLVVIKALHRQLGTRPVSRQNPPSTSDLVALVLDPVLSGSSSSSTPSAGSPPSSSSSSSSPPVFDSPTMFLVISCYVQLVKHLELVVKSIYDSICDTTHDVLGPAPMEFAEVAIIEASSQFILFSELVRHVIGQINLVLGLPSSWAGRSAWTGLLTSQRYRDMVNVELGAVEGMWTARPGRLMEMTRLTKEIFVELSMMGLDA